MAARQYVKNPSYTAKPDGSVGGDGYYTQHISKNAALLAKWIVDMAIAIRDARAEMKPVVRQTAKGPVAMLPIFGFKKVPNGYLS